MLLLVVLLALILQTHLGLAGMKGHLEPLGHQWEDPEGTKTPELHTVPQPEEFYDKFVRPRQPVVFRGAALKSAATSRWTIENLASEYGDLIVRLEARSEQDTHTPTTEIGFGRDTIRHFVNHYKEMNAYVISQVPQPMEKDISIPPCLRCGNFAKSIQEVHLFITAKGGKTALHRDPYSNIHCVFNGTKDWILIDNSNDDLVYQSEDSEDEFGGYSNINVDRVDLDEFPRVRDIRHSKVTLNGGDCIFMPGSYWHQVRVNGEYNTAVSIWFTRDFRAITQDWSDCTGKIFDFTPMSDVEVVWRFSGKNESLLQGHMDIHLFKAILLSFADADGDISIRRFCEEMIDGSAVKNYLADDVRHEFTKALGKGSDKIKSEDVRALSIDELKSLISIINPNDESNSPEYEYSYFSPKQVATIFESVLKGEKQEIRLDEFVQEYTNNLGGTESMARKIFDQLDDKGSRSVSASDLRRNLESVLSQFASAPRHDPTSERIWMRYLRARDEL